MFYYIKYDPKKLGAFNLPWIIYNKHNDELRLIATCRTYQEVKVRYKLYTTND